MGKLLQKLVHGLVPSWLTKVKSTSTHSTRKALPSSKAGSANQPSGSTTPPASSSTPPPLAAAQETVLVALACDEVGSPVVTTPRSSSMPRQVSEAAVISRQLHQDEDRDSLHVKEPNNRKTFQTKQGDDISDNTSSRVQSGRSDGSQIDKSSEEETLGVSQKEVEQYRRGGKQKAQSLSEYFENANKESLCLKRKSQSQETEAGNDEDDAMSEESGNSVGGRDIMRWAWKRRKGEKGILSCELPESICSIVGNGRAVVKQSVEPEQALWESMVEMIVGNGLHEMGNLEFLLFCYLSLNEPHLYPLIQASFLQVLKDLEKIAS